MPLKCSFTCLLPNSYTLLTSPSRKSRSWLTRIRVPSKSSNACFRISLVFMSRWLVGSSSISRFTGSSKSFIMARRVRSPPESTLTFFMDSSGPPNMKAPSRSRILLRISPFATSSMVWNTVRFSSNNEAWFCAKYPICTLCPIVRVPSCSISFMMHFTNVDFPSPFLPTKATLSPRSMVRLAFLKTTWSP